MTGSYDGGGPGIPDDGSTWDGYVQSAQPSGGPAWTDDWAYEPAPVGSPGGGGRGGGLVWILGGLAVVLAVLLAGIVGFLVARDDDPGPTTAAGPTSTAPSVATETVTATATPSPQSGPAGSPPADSGAQGPRGWETEGQPQTQGDLGLSTPLSRPACDGRGIVVLYSAVTPGAYAQEVGAALQRYPGASYLRTDMACPSLRQRDENGNVIYAVYRPSGYSRSELCADVRAAGGSAYGRWLDTTSDPTQLVTC
jgi:hypothetical protein